MSGATATRATAASSAICARCDSPPEAWESRKGQRSCTNDCPPAALTARQKNTDRPRSLRGGHTLIVYPAYESLTAHCCRRYDPGGNMLHLREPRTSNRGWHVMRLLVVEDN